jgi:hypothetical protein
MPIGRLQLHNLGEICFGSLADMTARSRHVRFTPDSGHCSVQVRCPKSATSGHRRAGWKGGVKFLRASPTGALGDRDAQPLRLDGQDASLKGPTQL